MTEFLDFNEFCRVLMVLQKQRSLMRIFVPGFPTQILLLCETRIQNQAYLSTNGGAAEEGPCACYCNWVGVVWSCIFVCILCMYVLCKLCMIDYDCI